MSLGTPGVPRAPGVPRDMQGLRLACQSYVVPSWEGDGRGMFDGFYVPFVATAQMQLNIAG